MLYEEKEKITAKPHNIIIEDRTRISVSGVIEVNSFDDRQIVAMTSKGSLILRGTDLHIDKLSLDSGTLSPLLKRLEQSGFLIRERSLADERGVNIRLTRKGEALAPKAASVFQAMGCRLSMASSEIARLQATLRNITERFGETED